MAGRRERRVEREGAQSPSALIAAGSEAIRFQLADALLQAAPRLSLLPPVTDGARLMPNALVWNPDLLLLDLDLPGVDGLTVLRGLGRRRARRTVVLAPGTLEGGRAAWSALALGARDLLPTRGRFSESRIDLEPEPLAARLSRIAPRDARDERGHPKRSVGRAARRTDLRRLGGLAIFARAGSIPAVVRLLATHPGRFTLPVLLVLDISPRFLRAMGEGIDRCLPLPVRRVVENERLLPREVTLISARQGFEIHRIGSATRLVASRAAATQPTPWETALHSLLSTGGPTAFGVVLTEPPSDRGDGAYEAAAQAGRLFRLRHAPAHRGMWGLARVLQFRAERQRAARI